MQGIVIIPPMILALIAYDVVGWGVGLALFLSGGRRSRIGELTRLLGFGLLLLLMAVVAGMMFLSGFAVMRFMSHGLFCVLAPLLMARGAVWVRHRAFVFGGLLILVGGSMDVCFWYARSVEPFRLEVTHHEHQCGAWPAGTSPITVAIFADLQTDKIGDYERDVLGRIDTLRPDLVLFPGDYLQIRDDTLRERERVKLIETLNALHHRPRYGMWGVDGDADTAAGTFYGSTVRDVSSRQVIIAGEPPIQLIGFGIGESRLALSAFDRSRITAFDGLSIVMGHAPDYMIDVIAEFEGGGASAVPFAALCVAGHTHGGQVSLPWIGPPLTLTRVPRRYAVGTNRLGSVTMHVSRGIGLERGYAPRIRFNCRPELSVITVRPVAR